MATKMGMADLQLVDREGEDTQRVAVLDAPYRLSVRNALIPVTIMLFLNIPWVISGAVIIENIFVIPGMGKTLTEAILNQDFPVVQACVLLLSLLTVLCNLACDVITAVLDPRIRISLGGSGR